jgi:hypothetical protein
MRYSRLPIGYFVFSFLIFPSPKPSFPQDILRKRNVLIAGGQKVFLLCLLFPYFPSTRSIFSPKRLRRRRMVLTTAAGGKKVLPTLSFLSLF